MDSDDRQDSLVRAAVDGNRAAFEELAELHRARLASLIPLRLRTHYLHRSLEPDDVFQETLTRAFRSIERFEWRGGDSCFQWLMGIAERVILEAARRHRRDIGLKLERKPQASTPSPSRLVRREERFDRLEKAVEGLSPDHRRVILLSRIDGLQIREIAARMGRSEDATKKLLARALRSLKRSFGDTQSFSLPERRFERVTDLTDPDVGEADAR